MAASAPSSASPGLRRAFLVLAWVLPALVLVQAALAGQHLFEGAGISLHGILGEVTFALTLVGVALAVVGRADGPLFAASVGLLALAFSQVGLGFVGRDTASAAAWHIPVGVAIFGLTTYQLALVRQWVRGAPQGT